MAKVTPSRTPEPFQGLSLQVPFNPVVLPMECLLSHESLNQYYSSIHCRHIEFVCFFPLLTLEPRRIMSYRDGVSEGQFSQVLLHEMYFITKACASLEDECC